MELESNSLSRAIQDQQTTMLLKDVHFYIKLDSLDCQRLSNR